MSEHTKGKKASTFDIVGCAVTGIVIVFWLVVTILFLGWCLIHGVIDAIFWLREI